MQQRKVVAEARQPLHSALAGCRVLLQDALGTLQARVALREAREEVAQHCGVFDGLAAAPECVSCVDGVLGRYSLSEEAGHAVSGCCC